MLVEPHRIQETPSGQRSPSRYARHFSSLRNRSTLSRVSAASIVAIRGPSNAPKEKTCQGAHHNGGDQVSLPQEGGRPSGRGRQQNPQDGRPVPQAFQGIWPWLKCTTLAGFARPYSTLRRGVTRIQTHRPRTSKPLYQVYNPRPFRTRQAKRVATPPPARSSPRGRMRQTRLPRR